MNDDRPRPSGVAQPPLPPGAPPASTPPVTGPYPPGPIPHAPAPYAPAPNGPGVYAPVPNGPGGHGAVPAGGSQSEKRPVSRKWLFLLLIIPIAAAGGLGFLFLKGRAIERDVTAVADEFFLTWTGGADVAPLLDGTGSCATAEEVAAIGGVEALEWEAVGARYSLESDGDGPSLSNFGTLDRSFARDFLSQRPGGTDIAVVNGNVTDQGAAYDAFVTVVREPGADWLVCAIDLEAL